MALRQGAAHILRAAKSICNDHKRSYLLRRTIESGEAQFGRIVTTPESHMRQSCAKMVYSSFQVQRK